YSVPVGSGFINSSTGVYTAPATLGTETVRVTDSALDTADATVYVAPAAPSNLVADGTDPPPPDDPQAVLLTWTDNATGNHGFKLERKLSGGSYVEFAVIPESGSPNTFILDTGFPPTLPHSYRVRAFAGTVYSGYSNEDFATP
ncbi:MAG TPA: hypothetical protein VMX75_09665, partial [Spirochaetia bacterium]|nr:hypothetical protein [Spirochaetia bacterium]